MVISKLSMPESNNQNFNHLKIHTQYSICEGAIKIDNLKNKNRLILYATHNRFFANMADCKLEMIDGNIKSINVRIK